MSEFDSRRTSIPVFNSNTMCAMPRAVPNTTKPSAFSALSAVKLPFAWAILALTACTSTPATQGPTPGGWTRDVAPFEVLNASGEPYAHPFLGGFDVPRPQFVDIDGDGDYDLFVQERTDELIFFENVGTPQRAEYVWRTDRWRDLAIGEWQRFADVDLDGDVDLLAERPFSYITYFRNVGRATAPQFELYADTLRSVTGEAIFADRQNIPHLTDIDCDKLPDLFLGRVDGTIARYEQAGVGEDGVPRFALVTEQFEGIQIVGQLVGSMRHGANSMFWADVDDDGDPDLYWGDYFEPGLLLIENTGTCANPNLRGDPVPVRADGQPIATSGYNAPYSVDIDADGDLDLFIGVLGGAFNPNRTSSNNLLFYERGADGALTLRDVRYVDGIDVGSESIPELGDIDGDGDMDLLVANKIDPADPSTSRVVLFENEGTRFRLADTLDLGGSYHLAPALGDLDGDGALDMVLGTWNDGLFLVWQRDGRWVREDSASIKLTRGSNAVPALGDLDGDGDLDLVVGEASGEVNYYENVGSASSPEFELVSDRWLDIDTGRRSAPTIVDLDGDGPLDLVFGRESSGALVYRNTGTRTAPEFVLDEALSASLPLPFNGVPAFADLDGDGRLELIAGGLSGGLVYYRR